MFTWLPFRKWRSPLINRYMYIQDSDAREIFIVYARPKSNSKI